MDSPPLLSRIVMSHPYSGQQYQESLTNPSTPQYPTWETLDNMSQPLEQQHDHEDTQQHQQQQGHNIDTAELFTSVHHTIEIPEQFGTTSPVHHHTIQLPSTQHARSDGLPSPGDFTNDHYGDHSSSIRPSTSTGLAAPTARSSGRPPLRQSPANPTRMHPYRRPQSAAPVAGPSTSSGQARGAVTSSPQVTTTPTIPLPASAMSTPPSSADHRVLNFGSAVSGNTPYTSPSTINLPPLPMTPSEPAMPHYLPLQHPPPHNTAPQYPQHRSTQQTRSQYQYPPIPPQPYPQRQSNPPRLQVQTQSIPPTQTLATPVRRQPMTPRSDMQYDTRTNVLTACLEIPGVRKDDLSVTLSTCIINKVKQVVIRGFSHPVFPPMTVQSQGSSGAHIASAPSAHATPAVGVGHGAGSGPGGLAAHFERIEPSTYSMLRERKYGEFSRVFTVPSDTKPEDVQAVMEDGVLTVRIAYGLPALNQETHIIPIR